jgi:hypothetical protein
MSKMDQRRDKQGLLKVQRVTGNLVKVTMPDGQSFYMKNGKIGKPLFRIGNESKRPE